MTTHREQAGEREVTKRENQIRFEERQFERQYIRLRERRMAILSVIREGSEWGHREAVKLEDDLLKLSGAEPDEITAAHDLKVKQDFAERVIHFVASNVLLVHIACGEGWRDRIRQLASEQGQ